MTSVHAASMVRCHCALAGLLATLVLGTAAWGADEIVESDQTVKSRGKAYAVDVFAPGTPGKYPAIVVLHGHGGAGENKRSSSHDLARRWREAVTLRLVPHYFGRLKPDPKNGQKNARSFSVWTRTVSDTITFAARGATSTRDGSGCSGRHWGRGSPCHWRRGIDAFRPWWRTTAVCQNGRT